MFLKQDNNQNGKNKRKFNGSFAPAKIPRGNNSATPENQSNRQNIIKQRNSLPIASAKTKFLEQARQNNCLVLVGETGSGKTTQIPQFLLESGLNRPGKCIAITQPRRVAAISLAQRVGLEIGDCSKVGYRVRFEDSTTAETKIIYQTDGMLLREAMLDPLLNKYSWIILDEAHERTVSTDILFGVMKMAQEKRLSQNNPLKIIVMSATLNAEKFSQYFKNCPILHVIGRQHTINVMHVTETEDDWQSAILQTVLKIHLETPPKEDILVFMTGQEEIEAMAQTMRNIFANEDKPNVQVKTLYAAQQVTVQKGVFGITKEGCRKIVLATNIAETSITIPGIKHVVDSCRVKAKVHQHTTGLDILRVVKVSQSQAWQRTGRAGRESEGNCYRMLTRNEFATLDNETTPEIKRCSTSNVILEMLSIGITKLEEFDFLEPPPKESVDGALRQLELLGAIKTEIDPDFRFLTSINLTELGKQMAGFPLDPKFTKAILAAKDLGCTEEVITIVSLLTGDSPIVTPSAKRDEAIASRIQFTTTEGDHITLLKIFRAFKQCKNEREFCQAHYLNLRHMQFASEVRKQLMEMCRRNQIPVQSCANHTDSVRKALAQGMFTNVAKLTRDGHYVTLDSKIKAQIHPSSVMFKTKPELVIFTELICTQKNYLRTLSLVDATWLIEAQPQYFRQHRIIQSGE